MLETVSADECAYVRFGSEADMTQERLSVTEARSRFGDEQACSFNWELSGQNRPPVDSARYMPTRPVGRSLN